MPRQFHNLFATLKLSALFALLVCSLAAVAQSAPAPLAKIPLPPLAWNSWNSFANTIDSNVIAQQAQALASSGLQKAGYQYVNIDEGWWLGERDADGNFIIDPKQWPAIAPGDTPGDMANIARYIHSLGLKAGIYTDAGKDGCSMTPDTGPAYSNEGSEGHYEQDFLQFAKWGFDYVKIDWCGGNKENLSPALQYGMIARAIARAEQITGKRLYYSICNWGNQSPWTWAPGVGGSVQDIWRTSEDLVDPVVANTIHAGRKVSFDKMMHNFDHAIHPSAQHTGYYNDPDIMILGMPGLNAEQNRLHMSLWSISGAPLLIGADITKLDAEMTATLSNQDAIAIDQDALGLQAVKVKELSSGLEVWSKFLSTSGTRAVLLLNRTYFPAPMSLDWAALGLTGDSASIKDVWAAKNLGVVKGAFTTTVPAQDGLLLIVRGTEGAFAHYTPNTDLTNDEKAITDPQTLFAHLPQISSPYAQVKIVYSNPAHATQVVPLYVNGERETKVAFPPTGSANASVWIQATLDHPGNKNSLNFAASPATGLKIESIDVHSLNPDRPVSYPH